MAALKIKHKRNEKDKRVIKCHQEIEAAGKEISKRRGLKLAALQMLQAWLPQAQRHDGTFNSTTAGGLKV